MKKQHSLFSSLIILFVLTAYGCQNNNSSDQASTAADSASATAQQSSSTKAKGQKTRINNTVDWATYRGDNEGSAYSALDQITIENVATLEEVWHYDTRDLVGPISTFSPL